VLTILKCFKESKEKKMKSEKEDYGENGKEENIKNWL